MRSRIDRAHGSRIIDADGREYIDYVCSWGGALPREVLAQGERSGDARCRDSCGGRAGFNPAGKTCAKRIPTCPERRGEGRAGLVAACYRVLLGVARHHSWTNFSHTLFLASASGIT